MTLAPGPQKHCLGFISPSLSIFGCRDSETRRINIAGCTTIIFCVALITQGGYSERSPSHIQMRMPGLFQILRLLLYTPTTFFTVSAKQGRSSSLAMAFHRIDTAAECLSNNIEELSYHQDWFFIIAVAGSASTMADSIDI